MPATIKKLTPTLIIVALGLIKAAAKGWTVVNMKDNWKTIFPSEKKWTAAGHFDEKATDHHRDH